MSLNKWLPSCCEEEKDITQSICDNLKAGTSEHVRSSQGWLGEVPAQVAQFGDRYALQAEQNRELAAMMDVVGHDTPDRPLARDCVGFPLEGMHVGLP